MAEGGNFSRTLEDGSEALFDHECTQCRAHGSKQEATDFCQDCKQFLCKVCGRYHIRYKETHILVRVASMTKSETFLPSASPVPLVAKCQFHPERDIEMYCGTHDMVYCCLCVAKEHRSCVNVHEVKEMDHKTELSTLQMLVDDISRVDKRLYYTKLEKSNNLKLIKDKKASILQEINAVRERMNKQLDALEQKIITELDDEQKKLEKEINADIKTADDLITALQRKPDLTCDYGEKQMFIITKLARDVLATASSFLKNANLPKRPTLTFEQNNALCDSIEKSDRLGKIVRFDSNSKRSNYTVQYLDETNVEVNTYNNMCLINDMCQLPNGSILLIDYGNNKLERLSDQLNVKDFLDLKAAPLGLCSVSPSEVAVRMTDKTIHFISVDKSLTYKRKISINDFNDADKDGMARCNNQLWIPGDKAVYVYSLSGTLVKKIETDSQGRKIFPESSPRLIAVSDDETVVYVAAWQDRVVVFNSNGDVITELRDQRLNGTIGICITEDDIVLVAGLSSKNVVMFDRYGSSLGELISSKDMISEPWSLCYDRTECRLLVGYNFNKAQIFQFIG